MNAIIIGPLNFGGGGHSEEKIRAVAEHLKQHGIDALVPHDLFNVPEIKSMTSIEFVKRILEHVCKADMVITLLNWHLEPMARKLGEFATQLDIEMIHEPNLTKWLSKNGTLNPETK